MQKKLFIRLTYFILTILIHWDFHSLNRSPNTVWVIKSRKLRWAGHIARMGEGRSALKILTGKPHERDI